MMSSYRGAAARLPTLLVLTGAIAIVQWHSIQFWSGQINPAIGWLWSVALEAAALWLWYQRAGGLRSLGACASLLLLAGPLYQVAAPILDAGLEARHADSARRALILSHEQAVRSAEAQLGTVLANSQAAPKWQRVQFVESIGASQRRADDARAALGRLLTQSPRFAQAGQWRQRAIIGMQALALIVLQLTGIICITSLRARVASGPIKARAMDGPCLAPRGWSVRPAGPSALTDALLPEPKHIKVRPMKRVALGPRGLDALLGERRT